MSEHEDAILCCFLRERGESQAALRLDTLHAQRQDLLERLDQSEQREHNLRVELMRARHALMGVVNTARDARKDIETTINANRAEAIADATSWPVQGLE